MAIFQKKDQNTVAHRALKSYVPAFLLFIVTFIQSIGLVPLFLKFWGSEKYGIWLTIVAFVLLMRTLDLGHQNFIGNEFSKYYHTDIAKARLLLASSIRIGILLGITELVIYILIIILGLHEKIVGIDLKIFPVQYGIFSFLIMWLIVGSVGGLVGRILGPMGKYSVTMYLHLSLKLQSCLLYLLVFIASFL